MLLLVGLDSDPRSAIAYLPRRRERPPELESGGGPPHPPFFFLFFLFRVGTFVLTEVVFQRTILRETPTNNTTKTLTSSAQYQSARGPLSHIVHVYRRAAAATTLTTTTLAASTRGAHDDGER